MKLQTGQRIGVYEVLSLVGAGGMGEVYRARDTRLGRDVAIKILPTTLTDDRERLARFEREARLLASLNHPNIATVHGFEAGDGIHGIVMELVDGQTLAELLATGSRIQTPGPGLGTPASGGSGGFATGGAVSAEGLNVSDALAYARQIVDALDAAHEGGIVHRDLKPANIKITPDGRLKILDFGLAKADSQTTNADLSHSPTITSAGTHAGVILGTAAYMSPEQARGKAVDKRSDIWAFGCVLYEMLTGRPAFEGETVSDTIGVILHREPDLDALPESTPQRVRELLRRCFEKDQNKRLRDIGDARFELDAHAVAPGVQPPPRRGTERLAWSVAGVAAAAAVVLALWQLRRPAATTAATLSVPHLSPAIRITNTAEPEFGPAISPDGKWVAYYATAKGRTDLVVKFLESGSTVNLTASLPLVLPTRAGQGGVAISPDGSTICFIARSDPSTPTYDTWLIPGPVGGVPRKLFGAIGSVQWSPDGQDLTYTIAGSTGGDGLGVAASDGTRQRVIVPREGGRHIHWPAWSRDGKSIYFIYTYDAWHTEPADIYRVAVGGGAPEPVVRSVRRAIYPAPLPAGDLLFSANPGSLELGLWWQRSPGDEPVALTNGVGEHIESRVSADGKRVVATLLDVHQSLISIPVNGGDWQPLTDGRSGDLFPSVDIHTGRIVFSSSRSGHRNLWIVDADGRNPTPLTTERAIDENPAFSPDGQQVAFVSDRGGERAIWVISALGGAPRRLAKEVVLDTLTWSRDGRRVYFTRPGPDLPSLASVDVVDGHVEPYGTPGAVAPAWSPSADVLAFMEITMMPAPPPGTGTASRIYPKFVDSNGSLLRFDQTQTMTNPLTAWDKEGKRLAVLAIAANGPAQIWIVGPEGSQPAKKLVDFPPSVRPRGIAWARDSRHVIVASQDYTGDIVMYDVNR